MFTTDWTTPGHTGVPVPLTAAGPGAEQLDGLSDDTDVFEVAREVLTGAPWPRRTSAAHARACRNWQYCEAT